MSAEIFVSYAREDQDWVERLAAALSRRGVTLWWDRRLLAGQSFEDLIAARLAAAPAVLVVWSAEAVKSHWVRDEAAEGRDRGRLVPLSRDGARPPFGFRQLHTPDLSGWTGDADAPEIDELLAALAAMPAQADQPDQDDKTWISSPLLQDAAAPDAAPESGGNAATEDVTWFEPRELREGEEIAHYRVLRKLAQGGFGAAYVAVNIHNDEERVVIKLLLPDMVQRDGMMDLLRAEASALLRVKHDAVVQYRTFGRIPASGEFYLVIEFLDGPTLAEWRKAHTPSVQEIEALATRLMSGLDAAHAEGIVHRDMSPDNVILVGGRLEKATIIDFGIAKQGALDPLGSGFGGKLSWAAPEQFEPERGPIGPWTDFYSVGLIMAFLARGQKLPIGGSLEAAIKARRQVPSLEGIPHYLARRIAGLLRPKTTDRPDSLKRYLAVAANDPTPIDPGAPPMAREEPSSPRRGWRLLAGGALALAAALAALHFSGALPWRETPSQPDVQVTSLAPTPGEASQPSPDPAPEPEPSPEPTPEATPVPAPQPTATPLPSPQPAGESMDEAWEKIRHATCNATTTQAAFDYAAAARRCRDFQQISARCAESCSTSERRIAAGQMAVALEGETDVLWIKALQKELARLSLYPPGRLDGSWGDGMQKAIDFYNAVWNGDRPALTAASDREQAHTRLAHAIAADPFGAASAGIGFAFRLAGNGMTIFEATEIARTTCAEQNGGAPCKSDYLMLKDDCFSMFEGANKVRYWSVGSPLANARNISRGTCARETTGCFEMLSLCTDGSFKCGTSTSQPCPAP